MKNKYYVVFVTLILIALAMTACTKSASTPAPEGETLPTLEGTQDPMGELIDFGTQTAIAQNGGEETEGEEAGEGATEGETEQEGEAVEEKPEATAKPEQDPKNTPAPVKEFPVPQNYILKKGEFPFCIARRFDVSPGALLAANGLTSSSVTYAGQKLKIPQDAGSFDAGQRSLKNHPTDYTIRAGDTIHSIACLFGDVDPRAINAYNGLGNNYTPKAGDVIKIP